MLHDWGKTDATGEVRKMKGHIGLQGGGIDVDGFDTKYCLVG